MVWVLDLAKNTLPPAVTYFVCQLEQGTGWLKEDKSGGGWLERAGCSAGESRVLPAARSLDWVGQLPPAAANPRAPVPVGRQDCQSSLYALVARMGQETRAGPAAEAAGGQQGQAGNNLRRLRREVAAISSSVARSASRGSFFIPSSSSKKGFEGATASSWGNW